MNHSQPIKPIKPTKPTDDSISSGETEPDLLTLSPCIQNDSKEPEPTRFRNFLGQPTDQNIMKKNAFYKKAGAGGIIVNAKTGKLLIVRGSSKWSLPKGHLDRNEKYHQCAIREIYEETNLAVNLLPNDRFIDVKKCIYYVVLLHDSYLADIKTNDPNEIKEVRWASIVDIKQLDCNRQLEYVVNRWDYVLNIINNYQDKVSKSPLIYPLYVNHHTDQTQTYYHRINDKYVDIYHDKHDSYDRHNSLGGFRSFRPTGPPNLVRRDQQDQLDLPTTPEIKHSSREEAVQPELQAVSPSAKIDQLSLTTDPMVCCVSAV